MSLTLPDAVVLAGVAGVTLAVIAVGVEIATINLQDVTRWRRYVDRFAIAALILMAAFVVGVAHLAGLIR